MFYVDDATRLGLNELFVAQRPHVAGPRHGALWVSLSLVHVSI